MTETLRSALRDEAAALDVPPPPADAVLARGRARRRTARIGMAVGALALATAVGSVAVVAVPSPDGDGTPDGPPAALEVPDPAAPGVRDWAVAVGSVVHLGDGTRVDVGAPVTSLAVTSAGAVARTADSVLLVSADGTVSDPGWSVGGRVSGTDPALPYVAYAERRPGADAGRSDAWRLVVRDVRSGDHVASTPFDGSFTWDGPAVAPPVALDGDHAYVALDDVVLDVEWRRSALGPSSSLFPASAPQVQDGRALRGAGDDTEVVDAGTGRRVAEVPVPSGGQLHAPRLSPDGSHVAVVPDMICALGTGECSYFEPTSTVLDLESGSTAKVENGDAIGWAPDGHLLVVDGASILLCDPGDGGCETTDVVIDDEVLRTGEFVRVGGTSFGP